MEPGNPHPQTVQLACVQTPRRPPSRPPDGLPPGTGRCASGNLPRGQLSGTAARAAPAGLRHGEAAALSQRRIRASWAVCPVQPGVWTGCGQGWPRATTPAWGTGGHGVPREGSWSVLFFQVPPEKEDEGLAGLLPGGERVSAGAGRAGRELLPTPQGQGRRRRASVRPWSPCANWGVSRVAPVS